MKRFLAVALLVAAPALAHAQHVISCPGVVGPTGYGTLTCDGFALSGGGSVDAGTFTSAADEYGLGLKSATDFNLVSLFLESQLGLDNNVIILGYTRDVVDVPFSSFPYPGGYGPHAYSATFTIQPGVLTPVTLNWRNIAAIKFDGTGGYLAFDPAHFHGAFNYYISDIVIDTTTAPEPTSLALLASGLLTIAMVHRNRWKSKSQPRTTHR